MFGSGARAWGSSAFESSKVSVLVLEPHLLIQPMNSYAGQQPMAEQYSSTGQRGDFPRLSWKFELDLMQKNGTGSGRTLGEAVNQHRAALPGMLLSGSGYNVKVS